MSLHSKEAEDSATDEAPDTCPITLAYQLLNQTLACVTLTEVARQLPLLVQSCRSSTLIEG